VASLVDDIGRSRLGLVSALSLVLASSACGSAPSRQVAHLGSAAGTTTGAAKPAKLNPVLAAVRFTNCMRAEGVPMLDPGPHGNILYNAPDTPESVLEKARKACDHFLPQVTMTPAQHAVALRRMIKFVDCMSAHQEPVQLLNGRGVGYAVRQGSGVDLSSPRFKTAEATCTRKYLRSG